MTTSDFNNQLISCFDKLSDAVCIISDSLIIEYSNETFNKKNSVSKIASTKTNISNFIDKVY